MNIIVCIKQVPAPEYFDKIAIDPKTGSILRQGVPFIINPNDRHAIEEALRQKEAFGGSVSVLTMGPSQAKKIIEEALAMGADKGLILCDPVFAGADTLATAHALSAGIKALGDFDLIVCGNETVDGATGQVPAQLAEFLGIPHVTHAQKIDFIDEKKAIVKRKVENGYFKIELKLPAVIAVLKNINQYRLPTAIGIMEAENKEIIELGCQEAENLGISKDDLGLQGSPTRVAEIFESPLKRKTEMIQGEPEDIARKLIKKLHELEAI